MFNGRNQQKKRKFHAMSRVREKWAELKRFSEEERKQILNRCTLSFHIDATGTGWEYIHFELDQRTVVSLRVSYIGPGVESFINELNCMKEEDCREIVFCDEPGEYILTFARKNDILYIELPTMKKGVFQEYSSFLSSVNREMKEKNL